MPKYYFLSGFDEQKGFPDYLINHFNKNISDKKSLVFICTTPNSFKINDYYFEINKNWFDQSKLNFDEVKLIDYRMSKEEAQTIVTNASCVFLCGGMTLMQNNFLDEYDLKDILRNIDVVMGMSAGAINMAKHSLSIEKSDTYTAKIYEGIGTADITVCPHFDLNNKELIDNVLCLTSNTHPIYCLCDNSAIFVGDSTIEYLGEVFLIQNSNMQKL